MAEYSLGTARGKIVIDYDGKGTTAAQEGLDSVEKKSRSTGVALGKVAAGAGIAGATIAGGLALAAKTAIDFEKQISAIGAVSGSSEQELELLRQKALQLGADTAFGAGEAALAMESLVKAGLSVDEVLNGAADATVALAAAGSVALPEAAELSANAMSQFNLSARELPHVADLIAGAANASTISVSDFGQSLAQVGAVANLAGQTFDDTAVAIALMGNAGIKGSDAGTSLKTMLSNLIPTTLRQKEAFRELGLETGKSGNAFINADGSFKSLGEVAGILEKQLGGLTEEQRALALETIFGSDAIRAGAVLTKAGAKGFNELAGAMRKVSAEDVAAKRLDNTAGAIERMKGSLETAGISIGRIFLPAITAVADGVGAMANAFSKLSPQTQKVIGQVLAVTAGVLLLVAAVIKIGRLFSGLGALFTLGPVGAIILAIVAAVALLTIGFVKLWRSSETFRNAVTALGSYLAGAFSKAWAALQPAFIAVGNFIQTRLVPFFLKLWESAKVLGPAVQLVAQIFVAILGKAISFISGLLGFLIPIIANIAGPILSALAAAIRFVAGVMAGFVEFLKRIPEFFGAVGRGISSFISGIINWAKNLGRSIVGAVSNFLGLLVQKGRDLIVGLLNGIKNMFKDVASWLIGLPGRVIGAVGDMFSALIQKGKDVINGLLEGLRQAWVNVKTWLGQRAAEISGVFAGALEIKSPSRVFREIGLMVMKGLQMGLATGWKPVEDMIGTFSTGIGGTILHNVQTSGAATPALPGGSTTGGPATVGATTTNNFVINTPTASGDPASVANALVARLQLGLSTGALAVAP